jgi:bifunctional DNA-binding transcriptional regulator/antitoxin component of YhaV-PrlF toxin-antitoxin module
MARQKLEDRNVRKLGRVGRGQTMMVTLPIEFVRELKWREKQKVVITKRGDTLIIKDWKD